MGSSHIRSASRNSGSEVITADPRSSHAIDRPIRAARALGRLRRSDLRRAAWWTLAVAAALAFNLMISLKLHAAAMTLPEDSGQLKLATSRQATVDNKNLSALGPQSEKFGIKPHVEFALTDRLSLGLGSETRLVKSGLESDRSLRTDGFMDTEFFLRGQLRDQDWYKISVQDNLRLPGQDTAMGVTQADSSLRLQYGRSGKIGEGSWTSAITGGFHPSLNHAPDKLQTDISVAWRPSQPWQFTAQSINAVALDDGDAGPLPNGIDSSKGQLSVTRNFTKSLSLQVGGWQMVSGGTGQPHGFDAIVWLRY